MHMQPLAPAPFRNDRPPKSSFRRLPPVAVHEHEEKPCVAQNALVVHETRPYMLLYVLCGVLYVGSWNTW